MSFFVCANTIYKANYSTHIKHISNVNDIALQPHVVGGKRVVVFEPLYVCSGSADGLTCFNTYHTRTHAGLRISRHFGIVRCGVCAWHAAQQLFRSVCARASDWTQASRGVRRLRPILIQYIFRIGLILRRIWWYSSISVVCVFGVRARVNPSPRRTEKNRTNYERQLSELSACAVPPRIYIVRDMSS